MWYKDVADLLNKNGFKAPKFVAPNFFIKI